jgi:AraC-like DNA-binding protein
MPGSLKNMCFPAIFFRVMSVAALNVRVNRAAVVQCEPEWSWHPDAENLTDFDFWMVWTGKGEMICEDKAVSLRPGSAFCLRPRQHCHVTHDRKHRLGVGYVHFDFLDALGRVVYPKEADLPPLVGRLAKVQFYEGVLRHVAEICRLGKAGLRVRAADYLKLVLNDFLDECSSETPSGLDLEHAERIQTVMRYVQENPGRIFTVSELSKLASYSTDYFTHVFTRVAGARPKEFCIRVRMERAQQLLRESRMSIGQIASALGYADMFFFSRQFKQWFGMSPRKWRKD